jgi:dTDP-4-dehydrorhamnose 3,5-epimerase
MSVQSKSLAIQDVKIVIPARHSDARGFFSETYNAATFGEAGISAVFIQDNQSLSRHQGTVRGLHYQAPPFAQAKLVRVLRGAIVDVAVDVRRGSPTYGKWVKAELSAEEGEQIFVPRGFLHGFVTLEPDTLVFYKVDNPYSREADGAVFWNDPDLAIDWGIAETDAHVSEKDWCAGTFADFVTPF